AAGLVPLGEFMSAILGQFHLDGSPVAPEQIARGMNALADYAVERSATWIEGQIGLGSHLRCFTPESLQETQPHRSHDRAIVADARIDNRDDLCDRLGIAAAERSTTPDSALILRAYEQWGEDCTAHLVGDFAFAIWDGRQQRLFCARDHIGARPFYFYHSPTLFAFATDPAGLLAFDNPSGVPGGLDERQVAAYLEMPMIFPKRQTFYRDIFKLPAGAQISVSADGLHERLHWSPELRERIVYKDPREYADHLRALIEEAVRARLRTPFPVAAHMSGGLDSSGVTVIAARLLRQQNRELVRAYTWSPPISDEYPLMPNDERARIQQICATEGVVWESCDERPQDVRAFYTHDIAADNQTDLSTEQFVLKHAAAHNVRTILSGWGGDDAVTHHGDGYLPDLLAGGHWLWLAKRIYTQHGLHPLKAGASFFRDALLPLLPTPIYNRALGMDSMPPNYTNPAFAARTSAYQHETFRREVRGLHTMISRQLRNGHITGRMEGWNIWGARSQLGYSYPLTDKRLLDFVLAVPPGTMVSLRQNRVLYRRAMAGILPHSLRNANVKHDAANELQRKHMREGMLRLLTEEVRVGLWDGDCPWLDMPRLRAALLDPPEQNSENGAFQFLQMRTAVEIWHLWQHHHAQV
ncbi:MAG: asparagine synthase-related protein, partial [Chloroflexota bacterium]